MYPLDNPIWQALTTKQASLAESCGQARRFIPEVSPLGGFAEDSAESYASLAILLRPGEKIGLFLHAPPEPRAGWDVVLSGDLLQMVYSGTTAPTPSADVVALSRDDVPDMIELAHLTKPGPFNQRTHELGDYFGIRRKGTLAAMAGERLRFPGYTEISAVCTHPDHLGNGCATALIRVLMERICCRNETPFLHVRGDNARAIQLYERLGFARRLEYYYAVLCRKPEPVR
jgi:ribosomal protein S18 acetylase RimI-like enzyme